MEIWYVLCKVVYDNACRNNQLIFGQDIYIFYCSSPIALKGPVQETECGPNPRTHLSHLSGFRSAEIYSVIGDDAPS